VEDVPIEGRSPSDGAAMTPGRRTRRWVRKWLRRVYRGRGGPGSWAQMLPDITVPLPSGLTSSYLQIVRAACGLAASSRAQAHGPWPEARRCSKNLQPRT
jgi:hypothetical protein